MVGGGVFFKKKNQGSEPAQMNESMVKNRMTKEKKAEAVTEGLRTKS